MLDINAEDAPSTVRKFLQTSEVKTNSSTNVSTAIISHSEAISEVLNRALGAIDSVHGDGELPVIQALALRSQTSAGAYESIRVAGMNRNRAYRLLLKPDTTDPEFSAVHEIGHMIDEQGFAITYPSSAKSRLFLEWQIAIIRSQAFQNLDRSVTEHQGFVYRWDGTGDWRLLNAREIQTAEYFARFQELWARSYAQYITIKSGNPLLREQLEMNRTPTSYQVHYWEYWEDEDFTGIMKAMDAIFQERGWAR